MMGQADKQTSQVLRITPIYDLLLRGTPQVRAGLYQLQLLTAEQLTRLHYSPGSIKMVKARLKALADEGYIQPDEIPSRKWRTPYYYAIGQKGMRYLESVGCDLPPSWRASKEINQHGLFVEHTLDVNDVLISALLLHREAPAVRLQAFEHERSLKRRPYKATWQSDDGAQTFTLIPDAFLDFYVNVGDSLRRMPVLLEHDRGTQEQFRFRQKIRAYIMLLKTGSYQQLFDTNAVTIAFTTFQSDERVQQMRAWTRAVLEGESRDLGDLFRFALLSRPLEPRAVWLGRQWLSPYETDQEPQPLLAA